MTQVENRVVSLEFDNSKFAKRIDETLLSIKKLQESLLLTQGAKGMNDLAAAANSFNISKMASSLDNISSKFTAMGAVGFATIQHLTAGVLDFVKRTGQDILAPILSGGATRARNIEQAKFMFGGLGLDVEKAMESSKSAVLGTAFGLDEAAKAAAQFGASGIAVGEQMTSALRGVAGAAAMTGSSFTEIADIFAGSAGSGKVTNQDLMQFATRGLNAAAAVGKVMGKTEEEIHEMATNGELDFKTFADAMDKAFGKHATEANKTYEGSLKNMRAALSRLGAQFFTGRDEQQRDLFNALTPLIDKVAKALKPLIDSFLALRRIGIDRIIGVINKIDVSVFSNTILNLAAILKNLWDIGNQVFTVLKEAFREIFPPTTAATIFSITTQLKDFFAEFKIGAETLENFKSIFKGVFAVVEIGWTILKEFASLIFDLVKQLFPAGEGLFNFAANAGDTAVRLNEMLVAGGGIHRFFERLAEVIQKPIAFLGLLKDAIVDFFSTEDDGTGVANGLDRVNSRIENFSDVWQKFLEKIQPVLDALKKAQDVIVNWFSELGKRLSDAFHPGDFNNLLDIINIGLLAGLFTLIKKIITGQTNIMVDLTGGVMDRIRIGLVGLSNTLQTMQLQLKAQALLKIASAIAILAASLVVLSLIDSDKLAKALAAMSVGFAQLAAMMLLLDKKVGTSGAPRLAVLSGVLIAMASAMLILSVAIKKLSGLDFDELAKGLTGVGVGLGFLVLATNLITANTAGLFTAGLAMVAMSVGMIALGTAVKIFASMSWGDMAKGLVGVATGLLLITTALNFMPATSILSGPGFLAIAIGLNILAGAIAILGTMEIETLAKGLGAIAIGLAAIALAMHLMPISIVLTGPALIALATGLTILAGAVRLMGSEDIGSLAKGIGAFAVMLAILSAALIVMTGTAAGAAALLVTASALGVLTLVIERLAKLSIAQIATGIGAIAAVLLVLGGAALLLSPLLPTLMGLGVALAFVGAGFTLFGTGALLVAKAFEAIAKSGVAGAKATLEIIEVFGTAPFTLGKALAGAVIGFFKELVGSMPLLLRLVEALLLQLLETVIKLVPEIAKAISVIALNAMMLIRELYPAMFGTGLYLLLQFLEGIKQNIGKITTAGVDIMVAWAKALVDNMPKIVSAAFSILTAFIFEIGNHVDELFLAGLKLLTDILQGVTDNIVKVIEAVTTIITTITTEIANKASELIQAGIDTLTNFLSGLSEKVPELATAAADLMTNILEALGNEIPRVVDAGFEMMIALMTGIADAIRKNSKRMGEAMGDLASAMVEGLGTALKTAMRTFVNNEFPGPMASVINKAFDIFDSHSPSRVFYRLGTSLVDGLRLGFTDNIGRPVNAVERGSDKIVNAMSKSIAKASLSLESLGEFNPVITPVLDLTKIQAESGNISKLMKVSTLTPTASFATASDISTSANAEPSTPDTTQGNQSVVSFEQNIYAPKELSTNDIYRNTKSQIVLAKEELGIS